MNEQYAPDVVELTVSQYDIARGLRSDARKCPFAVAARFAFPWARYTGVSGTFILLSEFLAPREGVEQFEGRQVTYILPPEATQAIRDYDGGLGMTPGTYTLTKVSGRT